ncbi:MAG TPA: cation-transporting P-type ATPase [Actinomycetota bacterium]|nr:cation-transporting P-type ATPase [Actinomycetota bacterium]
MSGRADPRRSGLSSEEARARLARDGPNLLPELGRPSAARRLLAQFVHFFALMLWVAGGLAFLAGLPELGMAIFAVIVVNGLFAFLQEHRAELAARRLRTLLPRRATALRDGGRVELDATELVVGDVLLLGPGDRVPADLRILEAHGLRVDTSTFTGESEPSEAAEGAAAFAGTFVAEGEATGVVTATGSRTRLAEIARLAQARPRPSSPLTTELRRVVRTISLIAIAVGVASAGAALLVGMRPADGFLFGVGVTVALVPEALLPTVTLALAIAAQRMARNRALVRRLESVETLGSTTFICTDKTGTLTRNEMAVVEVWTPAGRARVLGEGYAPVGRIEVDPPGAAAAVREAARAAARCSTGQVRLEAGRWRAIGDPMEAALDSFARRAGISPEEERRREPDRRRFPFDPRRRRMSVVVAGRIFVKGAPEAVIRRCVRGTEGAEPALEAFARRGLRVLAVAAREAPDDPADADRAESNLALLGLLGLEDPPRPEVAASIEACRRAGIRVAMVTGDHPGTARAVALEVGLAGPHDPVLSEADLPTDEDRLGAVVDRDGIVLARISPEAKLRIARALRRRGHVVAMTGDGVNDAPALHEADIGVAMGRSGTDVAREAADLVLLDDDFATIVAAVEHGRAVFANVRRFLTYHLTDNVAEVTPFLVWALSGGRIPLALGVLQILALDIGTDTLSATALGAEPPERDVLSGPPARGRLLDRTVAVRAFGLLGPIEAAAAMLAFLASFAATGWTLGEPFPGGRTRLAASGAAFATVVLAQTANAFACRSAALPPWRLGWWSNRLLVGGAAIELAVAIAALIVPPFAAALGHAPPPGAGWAVAFASMGAVLAADALWKAPRGGRR